MPRDPGLEELVKSSLGNTRGFSEKAMFGGWAWLLHGNLLCGAQRDSLLLRVGKDNEAWASEIPGVATAIMGRRRMSGWVRATPETYGNDALRQKLIDAALLRFTGSLPKRKSSKAIAAQPAAGKPAHSAQRSVRTRREIFHQDHVPNRRCL